MRLFFGCIVLLWDFAYTGIMKKKSWSCNANQSQALYGLGLVGALVYYVQHSSGLVGFLVALVKAVLWPAFVIYDLLSFLH